MRETSESVKTHYCQESQAIRLVVNLSINLSAVKPEPPLNLHLEMTEKGQVRICWSDPVLMPYPLQYEVKISANSGQNGWQVSQLCLLGFTMEQCRSVGVFQSSGFLTTLLVLGQGGLSNMAGLVELGTAHWFLLSWCVQQTLVNINRV